MIDQPVLDKTSSKSWLISAYSWLWCGKRGMADLLATIDAYWLVKAVKQSQLLSAERNMIDAFVNGQVLCPTVHSIVRCWRFVGDIERNSPQLLSNLSESSIWIIHGNVSRPQASGATRKLVYKSHASCKYISTSICTSNSLWFSPKKSESRRKTLRDHRGRRKYLSFWASMKMRSRHLTRILLPQSGSTYPTQCIINCRNNC